MENAFVHVDTENPHSTSPRILLKKYPELRALHGRNPYTFVLGLFLLGLHIAIAVFVANQSIWLNLILAYLVGSFLAHALLMVIHEGVHGLVFKSKSASLAQGLLFGMPFLVPAAASIHKYHVMHHRHQGEYDLDGDLPSEWECKVVGNSRIMKALWLLFYPLVVSFRPARLKTAKVLDKLVFLTIFVNILFITVVILTLGFNALLYFGASMMFAFGFHPLGARWIQRHFVFEEGQETYNYTGPLNLVALNIGYHNEHHDFPGIPWNRLPKVREIAYEEYSALYSHSSWTRLLFEFILSKDVNLYSRIVRD